MLSIGCAGAQLARSSEPAAARRGYLAASGSSVKAIVAGPIAIHVYAEVAGGRVFVTERKSGANIDGDCETAATREGSGPALPADRVQLIVVGAGEIACLATSGRRGYEMLWHARNDGDAPLVLAQGR
ncbi:MAG TPA: hypothetical protein VMU50_11025 [Polyangia bacterium]|nr:hypothetical protein [Polyangia bacterium]